MVCRIPDELAPAKYLEVGAPTLLILGLRETSLCILGSPYSLGGLVPPGAVVCKPFLGVGGSFFFSNSVGFSFVASVGSLASLLLDGYSRRELIICL
jgi:hypothetical protein